MPILTQPSSGPKVALIYITVGLLIDVWVAVWWFFFTRTRSDVPMTEWFILSGLFLTGLTLALIGFSMGRLGRSARQMELPPEEAHAEEVRIQQTAAATPHPVAPPTPPAPPAGTPMPPSPAAPATPTAPAAPPANGPRY
jgi:hypothetical protein